MTIQDYRENFNRELEDDATINGTNPNDYFVDKIFSLLEEYDELNAINRLQYFKQGKNNRLMQLDGYYFDEVDRSLSLFICDYTPNKEGEYLSNEQIQNISKKMTSLLDEMFNGDLQKYCDDSHPILKLEKLIKHRLKGNTGTETDDEILKIKLFILTNKVLSDNAKRKKQKEVTFETKPVEMHIWDLQRFCDIETRNNSESIVIDIESDFPNYTGISCIKGNIGENLGYQSYMAIIPAKLLAEIYIEYGSKVLEGNVRAFLGTNGNKSVNSGIKRTIIKEPTKFFIYNNGISTTAAKVETKLKLGELLITKIEDFQIINGGQTTASLAQAVLKKDNKDLIGIFVPMKLTVIEDRNTVDENDIKIYDTMVANISRYANTQNKVNSADFFSNSPFHITMEKLSKVHLAPPANGSLIPTGWYYERARKKYNQEQFKLTQFQQKIFMDKFPKKQVITKEFLAKCVYSAECKPNVVSKGNTFIMKNFGEEVENKYKTDPMFVNEYYFKKCVAMVILFKTVDSIVANASWYPKGGYKLNIVPYTIAKIINSIPNGFSVDWLKIWKNQKLSHAFIREIEIVAQMTNKFIQDSYGMIVTEYCKRSDAWENYKNASYTPTHEFLSDLINTEILNSEATFAKNDKKLTSEVEAIGIVFSRGISYWQNIKHIGQEKGRFNYKDISILDDVIKKINIGSFSGKQALYVLELVDKLDSEGLL